MALANALMQTRLWLTILDTIADGIMLILSCVVLKQIMTTMISSLENTAAYVEEEHRMIIAMI